MEEGAQSSQHQQQDQQQYLTTTRSYPAPAENRGCPGLWKLPIEVNEDDGDMAEYEPNHSGSHVWQWQRVWFRLDKEGVDQPDD